MRASIGLAVVLTGLICCANGCRKQVDKAAFITAIDKSYHGHHLCVWSEPTKLPAQIDPSKDEKFRDYDALTDAGLLIREYVEMKQTRVSSAHLNKYSLSDKGHSAWDPDPNDPDSGNFCFGHFNVTAIDKAVPNDPSNPTQYTVNYQYEVEGIPDWARTPESMRAFRKIAADTSIQSATTVLVKSTDGGWAVVPVQPQQ